MKTLEDILVEFNGSMINIKKGSIVNEANRLAKYIGGENKIKKPEDEETKASAKDTTSGDDSITYKSLWHKIGNHEVRTIGRESKFPIKTPTGNMLIKRHNHSVEVKDPRDGITEYKASTGTGQKGISYKIIKPELNSTINRVSDELDIPRNKVVSLFNMTVDDIRKQIFGYKEAKETEDGIEETWVEGKPEYASLKRLNNRDLNILKSKVKIPESITKAEFISTVSNRLGINPEDADSLTDFNGTPKGIKQQEKPSEEEQQLNQQSSIAAQLEMLDDIKEIVKDPESSDLDKQESFGQARTIEMRLEKLGIEINDPISNYYMPSKSGASSMASGFAKNRNDSTIGKADPEKIKQIQAKRPREENPLERLKKQLVTQKGMGEEEAEAKAKDLMAKNPGAVFFPEHKLIKEIDKFLLG